MVWVLAVLVIILAFICYNLYHKVERYEQMIGTDIDAVETRALSFYTMVMAILLNTISELRRVDKNGAFASDDEVGFTFTTILELIEQTKAQIQQLNGTDETENGGDV